MGTPLYMSPEQVQGQPVDPRTDIYSLGVTCYHLLAGEPPFRGSSAYEVAMHHVHTLAVPMGKRRPDLPPALCAMIDRMMAKRPEDRYQSAKELLRDLSRLRESLGNSKTGTLFPPPPRTGSQTTLGEPTLVRPRRPSRLRRWAGPASLLAALTAGALVGWMTPTTPSGLPGDDVQPHPADESAALVERERRILLDDIEKTAQPRDHVELVLGVRLRSDLAHLYLEDWLAGDETALDEANALFAKLRESPNSVYKTMGQLGDAIVLALRDRAKDSNQRFSEVLGREFPLRREHLATLRPLLENARLRYWLARAFDRNRDNDVPPSDGLERWDWLRRPGRPRFDSHSNGNGDRPSP
jgi:serine/threonine-protein kinase